MTTDLNLDPCIATRDGADTDAERVPDDIWPLGRFLAYSLPASPASPADALAWAEAQDADTLASLADDARCRVGTLTRWAGLVAPASPTASAIVDALAQARAWADLAEGVLIARHGWGAMRLTLGAAAQAVHIADPAARAEVVRETVHSGTLRGYALAARVTDRADRAYELATRLATLRDLAAWWRPEPGFEGDPEWWAALDSAIVAACERVDALDAAEPQRIARAEAILADVPTEALLRSASEYGRRRDPLGFVRRWGVMPSLADREVMRRALDGDDVTAAYLAFGGLHDAGPLAYHALAYHALAA